jgi:hypothetical protein
MTGAELEVWISEHQFDVPGGPSCPIDGAGDAYAGALYPGAPVRECYGLSSLHPHPLGSRAADCPECPHPCDGGRCPDPAAHAEGAHDL